MYLYAQTKEKTIHMDISSLINIYPDEPIKKIAVLFTDLVGSTNYFKKYGDKAGRKMLQEHYGIASPIINEYGGKLLKALGDSVMASFIDPQEAFKSAIKMQQQFQRYNNEKSVQDRVLVRIGIHYGNVIVEEKDIFGDVVNVASKLTNLSDGGQIYISSEVHEVVKHMPLINFELINSCNNKNMLEGLIAFKVAWSAAVELNPAVDTMLYLRPLWKLCENDFNEIWNELLDKKKFWQQEAKNEQILSDKSLLLTMKESSFAFIVAEKILIFLNEAFLQKNKDVFIPIQIIIDTSPFFKEDKTRDRFDSNNWEDINPGVIYISSDAYELIKKYFDVPATSMLKRRSNRIFYKVLANKSALKDHPSMFLFRHKIVIGEFPSCYYCGCKNHLAADCPSKKMPEITHTLEGLGYLSIVEINELFFRRLIAGEDYFENNIENPCSHLNASSKSAYFAFFELKRVFQLRFLRTVWNVNNEDWNKMKETKGEADGGMAWLAQDSLRVSDINRAESILNNALKNNQADFPIYCTLGYLNIEKNDLLLAEQYFDKALLCVKSNTQKIFLLLLISRLYMLKSEYSNARKKIKNILLLSPDCTDAVYQEIVLKFYEGKEKSAVQRLVKLIENNRVYFVYALIDPDLAPYSNIIDAQLSTLYGTAEESVKTVFREAEEEINKSKNMLDAQSISETQALMLKAKNMFASESYFGYLDIIFYCNSIILICKNRIKERKRDISERLYQLNGWVGKYMDFAKEYQYPRFINSYRKQLVNVAKKIDQAQTYLKIASQEEIGSFEAFCEGLSADLRNLKQIFKKLDILQQLLINLFRFLKKSTICILAVFFVSMFAVPAFTPFITRVDATWNYSVWFYQKSFFIVGSITGIGISLFLTIKKIICDDR